MVASRASGRRKVPAAVAHFSPLDHVTFHQLPNGLRIYLKEDHQSPLVSAHAWINVGSVDEDEVDAGISHILEHMVFKGTKNHAAEEISRWVEALGGSLNAETAKEYTHYYIDVPSDGCQQAIHLLAELLHRASFDSEEWARECPVILEEIKRRNDDPQTILWDLLNEALFEEVHRRRPVIGYPATVATVTIEALKRYYQTHYSAARTAFVLAGDFKTSEVLTWLEKEFADMPPGTKREHNPAPQAPIAAKKLSMKKSVQQSYLAFGFATPPAGSSDHEVLDLLASILGDGRGARLVNTLREDKKLVWSISVANLTHEGPGVFGIFADCDPSKREAVRKAIEQQMQGLKKRPPTEKEIMRAKNILQTAWLQGFETYHNQAATVGLFAVENQLERLKHYLPTILSITRKQLRDVIERYASLPLSSAAIEA